MLCLTQSRNREINFRTSASYERKKGTGEEKSSFFGEIQKIPLSEITFYDDFFVENPLKLCLIFTQ
jgi:hypothetical protein